MPLHKEILKVGLAITEADALLLVRKRGGQSYILPGGKPEAGEDERQALFREIDEELGCTLDPDTLVFLGAFSDVAADLENTTVTVKLYAARLVGSPRPRSEIESLAWFRPNLDEGVTIAPSLKNQIVPFLCSNGRLACAR